MFSGLRKKSATNHFFVPKIDLFHNDRYVDVIALEVAEIPPEVEAAAQPLRRIEQWKSEKLVLANWLASVLENICQHPSMRPVRLVYRDSESEALRSFDDACAIEPGLGDPHPFELYRRTITNRRSR